MRTLAVCSLLAVATGALIAYTAAMRWLAWLDDERERELCRQRQIVEARILAGYEAAQDGAESGVTFWDRAGTG